ncbi:MAG: LysM peptidoglycan-binding domain-containing protein [Solirubrobacteraceae bacterium]
MRMRILFPLAAAFMLGAPAGAWADFGHVVGPGESLSSAAAADGLSVAQLAAANGLPLDAQLTAGSTLMIPPQAGGAVQTGTAASSPTGASTGPTVTGDGDGDGDDSGSASAGTPASPSPATPGSYAVQPGDTLSAIAVHAGASVAALAAANGIDPNAPLLAGTMLRLSGAGGTSAAGTPSGASAGTQPVGVAAQGSSSGGPYPTAEHVTASQVAQVASANGVPPSLAEAIGWQESGFNNGLVSSADARGVMQILPGTWDWIGKALAGPIPLAPASALGNVRGGALLLHSLLFSTGGDPAQAAAGYYQGLSSVQRYGMFPSTQQYVGNVLALARQFGGG